ncbi:MAG: HAD family hydrolase [Flaviflexus sp.]|uniref:HAD family hydrolase n=1 Tax=Flaviflexus sp. TaxID=1969482 RepID=UPI003F91EE29
MALTHRPHGLLLDFGGVVFETQKRPTGLRDVARHVREMLLRGGYDLSEDELARELEAGRTGLKHWKHSSSRRPYPTEIDAREVVGEFLFSRLPEGPRRLLIAEATELLATISMTMSDHIVRPGIPELLEFCKANEIPLGIVSNAHAGLAHRRILAEHGLDSYFGVQVYSDEVGIRKPHPGMIALAADALHVDVDKCWYVGDTQDRDVAAGRAAGVAGLILTRSKHTDNPPFYVRETPDAVFDDPRGLLDALINATEQMDPYSSQQPPASSPQVRVESASLPTGVPAGASSQSDPASSHQTSGSLTTNVFGSRAALLIDHGGVISTSTPNPEAVNEVAEDIASRIPLLPGDVVTASEVCEAIDSARAVHKKLKTAWNEAFLAGSRTDIPEQQPTEFWATVNEFLGVVNAAWFRAEAHDLTVRFARAKTSRTLRPGIPELFETCRENGMAIIVVSNTISGRTVRSECERHGLTIDAFVCSDEIGVRKPSAPIFEEALAIASADPKNSWFLGDKPVNDAAGARRAGIANRALIRGGSTPDNVLDNALSDGTATLVVDTPQQLSSAIIHSLAKEDHVHNV